MHGSLQVYKEGRKISEHVAQETGTGSFQKVASHLAPVPFLPAEGLVVCMMHAVSLNVQDVDAKLLEWFESVPNISWLSSAQYEQGVRCRYGRLYS